MKLSDIDQVLIRYADTLSPEQIAFKIEGRLSAVQVQARIQELVATPDWLTATQQDQLVTLKMRQIVVELEEMPRSPRNAEIILNGLDKVGARLEKRAAATEQDLSTLYAFQGVAMYESIEAALGHMRGMLTGTGADKISEADWDRALDAGLRYAQMKIAALEAGPREPEPYEATIPIESIDPKALEDEAAIKRVLAERELIQ